MIKYIPYIKNLEQTLSDFLYDNHPIRSKIHAALDGEPGKELRRLVDLKVQKSSGAFFTSKKLAKKAAFFVRPTTQNPIVVDPACGVGDLLLAYANYLPLSSNLKTTLDNWGKIIYGYDIQPEFIKATKIRLALLAIMRGAKNVKLENSIIEESFPKIIIKDGITALESVRNKTNILANPPYTFIKAPHNCYWASGNVSLAAVFIDKCVSNAIEGTKISAILPDVLRTGTRYKKWRDHISSLAEIKKIKIIGQFDKWTDVDVFVANFVVKRRKKHNNSWGMPKLQAKTRIKDLFNVNVGSVVPHRDLTRGPLCPFISAKLIPKKDAFNNFKIFRRFSGRLFSPPFVVIRRTSRPDDKNRIIANLITGNRKIAIENHLLVISPFKQSVSLCKKLISTLKSNSIKKILNRRIRCRHLTVSAIEELPIGEGK